MDELLQARAELALLEEQARRLLKELFHVRAAMTTQRAKVDELIRTRPTAFNLFPTGILLSIFGLCLRADDDPNWKYQLAGVCRRWKDIIWDSPSFWTTIHVASSASSIMTHLERSRGALLDIVIETSQWSRSHHRALVPSLKIIGSLAHRWHSLSIAHAYCDDEDDEINNTALADFIIKKINHLRFPSLKSVALSYCKTSLAFLCPARVPALEHLELVEFVAKHGDFPPVAALKTLNLDFYGCPVDYPLFPHLIPTQALTKLSLSGLPGAFSPQPNSIYFPALKMLDICCLAKAGRLMGAIVAPNLERFEYHSFDSDDPPSVALHGLRSKFTNVRHLTFYRFTDTSTPEILYADAITLCEAFPGVRHVELGTHHLPHLFNPTLSNARARRPIDLWTELESLSLCGLHPKWLESDQFSAWLVDRQALGLRKLHVKLVRSYESNDAVVGSKFPRLYKVLKENCILELDNFRLPSPEMYLYATEFSVEIAFAGCNNRTSG